MSSITFSGYEWDVRGKGRSGPGPNLWDDANAHVDAQGWLHLKITNSSSVGGIEWRCVEVSSQERLGRGRYQFQVIGRIDKLDPNVVLGLFKYPTPDVGRDGTNEIDIEFSQWGNATAKHNADYVVYPAFGARVPGDNLKYTVALNGEYTTHRFVWQADQVTFQGLTGHRDDDANEFERWEYHPNQGRLIPQQPTPVRMNLWLFNGMPPSDNTEVEIIISQFAFILFDQLDSAPRRARGLETRGKEQSD